MLDECAEGPARKTYTIRMLVVTAAYIALVYSSVHWLKRGPAVPWKYIIAVLPVFPMFLVPVFVVERLRKIDELQRRIQLEALGFAFAATALSTLTYGFLENAGLPGLNWMWVWPLMAAFWIIGLFAARWRYR